jgi:hypothetical protein
MKGFLLQFWTIANQNPLVDNHNFIYIYIYIYIYAISCQELQCQVAMDDCNGEVFTIA